MGARGCHRHIVRERLHCRGRHAAEAQTRPQKKNRCSPRARGPSVRARALRIAAILQVLPREVGPNKSAESDRNLSAPCASVDAGRGPRTATRARASATRTRASPARTTAPPVRTHTHCRAAGGRVAAAGTAADLSAGDAMSAPAVPQTPQAGAQPRSLPQTPPQRQSRQPPAAASSRQDQEQVVCAGCSVTLRYPSGASDVRCSVCNVVTSTHYARRAAASESASDGNEGGNAGQRQEQSTAQLVCGGCRSLLMYVRGASTVQCSVCSTLNLAGTANAVGHLNCGSCGTMLMYAHGAASVRCAVCEAITETTGAANTAPPRTVAASSARQASRAITRGDYHVRTVIIENPPSVDAAGRVVANMAVGIALDHARPADAIEGARQLAKEQAHEHQRRAQEQWQGRGGRSGADRTRESAGAERGADRRGSRPTTPEARGS